MWHRRVYQTATRRWTVWRRVRNPNLHEIKSKSGNTKLTTKLMKYPTQKQIPKPMSLCCLDSLGQEPVSSSVPEERGVVAVPPRPIITRICSMLVVLFCSCCCSLTEGEIGKNADMQHRSSERRQSVRNVLLNGAWAVFRLTFLSDDFHSS
jgi:hypothetical protein